MRVPFIIFDPRAKEAAGTVRDELVLNIDIAPTILELAGVRVPEEMDGRSLVPLIRGDSGDTWRTHFFFEHQTSPATIPRPIPRNMGVRSKTEKYVVWTDPSPHFEEFYDLEADPIERHNRIHQLSARADQMRTLFENWEKENPDTYTHMPYTHRPQSGAAEIDWNKLKAALPTHFKRIEAEVKRRGVTWEEAFNNPDLRWEIGLAAQYFY